MDIEVITQSGVNVQVTPAASPVYVISTIPVQMGSGVSAGYVDSNYYPRANPSGFINSQNIVGTGGVTVTGINDIIYVSGSEWTTAGTSLQKTYQTPRIDFKTVANYSVFTIPTNNIFLIDSMEIFTTDIVTPGTAPTISIGNTDNFAAYVSGNQVTSNSQYARHIYDNPQNAVSGNTTLAISIVLGSTATVHSGILLFKGTVISIT